MRVVQCAVPEGGPPPGVCHSLPGAQVCQCTPEARGDGEAVPAAADSADGIHPEAAGSVSPGQSAQLPPGHGVVSGLEQGQGRAGVFDSQWT